MSWHLSTQGDSTVFPLAQMLGDPTSAYRQNLKDWAASVTAALREAVADHMGRNGFFRAQCEATGLDPETIQDVEDLRRVPLLPVSMFKRPDAHVLLSCEATEIENEIRSTGTSGVPSVARRDRTTLSRVLLALTGTYWEFLHLSGGAGLFMSPSSAEAAEMGMVKVFNVLNGVFDDHDYLAKGYSFNPEETLERIRRPEGRMTRHLVGPPFLIGRLLRYLELEGKDLRLDADTTVVTLGGWKQYTGRTIQPEEFRLRCHELLGVAPENVRDMYGLIESNMLAVECRAHRKHVPPWCYVSVRDVDDASQEVPPGADGAIAVLDPLSTSYPGFILSDDIGYVDTGTCSCGRTGQVVTFRRRRQGAELGCCAVSIERYLDAGEVTRSCEVPSEDAQRGDRDCAALQ